MSIKDMTEVTEIYELKLEHLNRTANNLSNLEVCELELIKEMVITIINRAIKMSNSKRSNI